MVTKKELIELSNEVINHNKIYSNTMIVPIIELGQELSLPLRFKAKVFKPGEYKGFVFEKEDIKMNMNSIFKVTGNVANNELNIDHKGNRKNNSSIVDLAGSVVAVSYDSSDDSLWMDCEVTNRNFAEMIYYKTIKYVSLRINPLTWDSINGKKVARTFDLEELSLVRTPFVNDAIITDIRT